MLYRVRRLERWGFIGMCDGFLKTKKNGVGDKGSGVKLEFEWKLR
jgi:hypothetical protein